MTTESTTSARRTGNTVTIFLCGDVMVGRGIDQILPHPSEPQLFEPWVRSAVSYVELAEEASGRIPRATSFDYVWGDALEVLDRIHPDARIVNLETAITTNGEAWPTKGIHYRMHPQNLGCLVAAKIDCCALANNHVLDWGYAGLEETLGQLQGAGIRTAGAGANAAEAARPAVIEVRGGTRVLVSSFGMSSSGVPREWRARRAHAGVNWVEDLSSRSVEKIARQISPHRDAQTVVIASLHWGGNWGYDISAREREFAHALIDTAGVDLVHGHSSHHPKGIEVYRKKGILYGCGDFLNDYEGIGGYGSFRGDLALMYFAALDARTGELVNLSMIPMQIRCFRVRRAPDDDVAWLARTLDRECAKLGTRVTKSVDQTFTLEWN